ncbi:hypothetical protein BJF79_16530 [Actinomadura sp. CNU-125]|uniref:Uma2 family endonuclease n=1 Tax=Actinomadura sp. CNU-125 TaxID=1904961 RepID=UPI0009699A03|nr:Uma2 family endonuclease [Actinomadura sp. CNU-125]OLT19752.1 hypothetical protein BJF79_16530 [Actinomadura sp. CNU-125]
MTPDSTDALEHVAAFAERTGFAISKLESFGDQIAMTTGMCWEHGFNITVVREQIPAGKRHVVANVGLRLTAEPTEPVPGLVVAEERLAPGAKPWAHESELLVEVVSQNNYREDYAGKQKRYARSGAPQHLLVDPREGPCLLYTEPLKTPGVYRYVSTTSFGEPVAGIACMDGADLDTSEFLRYT